MSKCGGVCVCVWLRNIYLIVLFFCFAAKRMAQLRFNEVWKKKLNRRPISYATEPKIYLIFFPLRRLHLVFFIAEPH